MSRATFATGRGFLSASRLIDDREWPRERRKAFICLTIRAKMIGMGCPHLRENLAHTDPPAFKLLSPTFNLFSPVAPHPRWTSYVVPKSPKEAENAMSKIWTISCDTVQDIGCQLLLITKSHKRFRLIPISMTLNDLERRNSPYFVFFYGIRLLCWPSTSHWRDL